MAPWHIEYFKLKEFEKWHVQERLSDLPLKQVINPPMREALPIPARKEHPYSQRQRDTEQNLKEQALLTFYSSLPLAHVLCAITSFHGFPLLIKPSTEPLSFNHFFRSSFPYEAPCHINLILNNFVCFSPVNLSCQFIFQTRQGPYESKGKLFPPLHWFGTQTQETDDSGSNPAPTPAFNVTYPLYT